jgi:hypothetical protein
METFYFLCRYEGRDWSKVDAFDEFDAEVAATKYAEAEWKRDKSSSPLKNHHDTAIVFVRLPEEHEIEAKRFKVSIQFVQPWFYADEVDELGEELDD